MKQEDGWGVDIGAVVRLAPIKDIKTMIYAFFELSMRKKNVRLHIMGGVDDEEYAAECYALVEQLRAGECDLYRTRGYHLLYGKAGLYDSDEYFGRAAAVRAGVVCGPASVCDSTDVGCCRELLNGKPGDTFGEAGYCVPPMYREGLAAAMERMCESRSLRLRMGKNGQARVKAYYRQERMLQKYRRAV